MRTSVVQRRPLLEAIRASDRHPRKRLDAEKLEELAGYVVEKY